MFKLLTASSATVAFVALLLTFIPSWRVYIPFLGTETISEEAIRIHALAAAQNYTSSIVSVDPLVVYLDDFLSAVELDNILNSSSPLFVPSQVYSPDDTGPPHRTSLSCILPSSHPLAAVIFARALQFLKTNPELSAGSTTTPLSYYGLEDLQLVKYFPSQYYHHHVDWFDALIRDNIPGKGERGRGRGNFYNRVASFFIYLEDECVGGMTEFPDLKFHSESSGVSERSTEFWDERMTVGKKPQGSEDDGSGDDATSVAFRPRKGSGVFWVNLQESGLGDERVSHAALPVEKGEKVGMNIWVKRSFGW